MGSLDPESALHVLVSQSTHVIAAPPPNESLTFLAVRRGSSLLFPYLVAGRPRPHTCLPAPSGRSLFTPTWASLVRDKSPSPGKPKRMATVKRAKPSKLSPGERKVLAAIKTALRGKLR